jgi:Pyruvate/2-oxoacid:ferredoxin oxidoreductase delta subunit
MILDNLKLKYADYRLNKVNKLEMSLNGIPGSFPASENSPAKKMPDKLEITLKTLPKQLSIANNMEKTIKSLDKNPENRKVHMDSGFKDEFEKYAFSMGINKIGYTDVPSDLIFKNRSILFKKAIILTMEMDEEAINMAPSPPTQEEGIVTYDDLGKKTNALAHYLRDNGFSSHPSHPAGGLVVYTQLARKAGMGHVGRHGLFISPELGPRQRISAIFISAENLPDNQSSEHLWINDFCASCGRCIKKCPDQAIVEEKTPHGVKTKIISDLCHGCTICMKECSFNRREYDQIKNKFDKQ